MFNKALLNIIPGVFTALGVITMYAVGKKVYIDFDNITYFQGEVLAGVFAASVIFLVLGIEGIKEQITNYKKRKSNGQKI